ncbi:unnamed protein product [Cuscuta campestris]|uniref:UBP-type domain-containing protein n=1 Tax=Cuscuta campestris TaxID=132261 RepID=A0A484LP37_9ASTE|nr:unnamed protein product [Cuscuta campestris]
MASSSVPVVIYEEEELVMDDGSGSGWVEPRTSCDHLTSLSQDLAHIPHPATPCSKCQHPMENWLCLSCKQVFCSRFVNKHMVDHHEQTPNHSVALSFRPFALCTLFIRLLICSNLAKTLLNCPVMISVCSLEMNESLSFFWGVGGLKKMVLPQRPRPYSCGI